MADKLIIFDTTLRDGEQSPGASMTRDEKLRIARQLERLRVDVIEAGFAASSNGDFEAVQAIANAIKDSTICSLSRANDRDISRAAEALKGANSGRIHTFIATSPLHMEKKLRMTPDQVFEQAVQSVRFARNLCADIEFSPEDGYRSDPDYLCRVLEAVIAEGATTINVPDTVGYAVPELYGNFIKTLRERIPNSDKAIWSVHCHNDLGMAVANSLAGVKIGGARQVECTINGLGERAGNAALEEVVMALRETDATTQALALKKAGAKYVIVQLAGAHIDLDGRNDQRGQFQRGIARVVHGNEGGFVHAVMDMDVRPALLGHGGLPDKVISPGGLVVVTQEDAGLVGQGQEPADGPVEVA